MKNISDVTRILSMIESGDQQASEELLPLVYEELRRLAAARMASQPAEHTLQATALVHEAYVRLVDTDKTQHWDSRGHFFAVAAEAMRRILVDYARRKIRVKHGGDRLREPFDGAEVALPIPSEQILSLHDVLEKMPAYAPPPRPLDWEIDDHRCPWSA